MLWRLAARAITGPVAFFIAGVIDVVAFAFAALKDSLRQRATAHRRHERSRTK